MERINYVVNTYVVDHSTLHLDILQLRLFFNRYVLVYTHRTNAGNANVLARKRNGWGCLMVNPWKQYPWIFFFFLIFETHFPVILMFWQGKVLEWGWGQYFLQWCCMCPNVWVPNYLGSVMWCSSGVVEYRSDSLIDWKRTRNNHKKCDPVFTFLISTHLDGQTTPLNSRIMKG